MVLIYHNPLCSKSRAACAILEDKGVRAEVVRYLDVPPSRSELLALLEKLRMQPSELVRKGEEICETHYLDREMSEEDWLDAMLAHPILIERPIVVVGERAIIGRPPEKLLELLPR